MIPKNVSIWWGPPRKFSRESEERRISWLELFYDLVYVIVISRATHQLAAHPGWEGLGNYLYLFVMIFWGWANGSLYHDLHGSPGIRTRFMTLWQMVAVAALAVTLDGPPDTLIFRGTIALVVLQGFITYLWWSVGIYDKEHRRLNLPYTFCYLGAMFSMLATLFVPPFFQRILFGVILVLNFLPPFLGARRFQANQSDFSLSKSMMERLGLLTIIVFGEAILGVIGGTGRLMLIVDWNVWFSFGLGILVVFSLWWIFFALVADRENEKGFIKGQLLLLLFIPTLASLGMTGASFPGVMAGLLQVDNHEVMISRVLFGAGVAVFLWSITAISLFLEYPRDYDHAKKLMQPLLLLSGVIIIVITWVMLHMPVIVFLLGVFLVLFIIIFVIMRGWYQVELKHLRESE